MNKRIKSLALQAGYLQDEFGVGHWDMPECQKFAELIVAECVSITGDLVNRDEDGTWTSNELYTDYNGALFEVKRRIEQHFGVE